MIRIQVRASLDSLELAQHNNIRTPPILTPKHSEENKCRKMESTMRSKCVMILGMVGVIVLCGDVVVGQCSGMGGLIKECGVYVKRSGPQMNPSRKCCEEIKNADVACVCNHLTNHMLQLIDMQKLHNVADSCGRPIPSGTKCGGIICI